MTDNTTFNWTMEELGNLINPPAGTGGVDMVQASPQTALQNQFMQTPAYQLMYGNNTEMDPGKRFFQDAGTQLRYGNVDPNMSPADRFRNDEGTQLAVQQGMKPLLNSFASQGLAQSGALSKALTDYSFNHYNDYMNTQQQSYNNYTNNQGSLFNNYQNQLAGLTNMGTQNTGNQNALSNQQMLAQILAGANSSNGQNLAGLFQNAGNNISSLLANMGTNGMGAWLNTGGLQNTNFANGLSSALQAYFAQQAGGASAAGGAGAMQGSGAGNGGFF
jgi:hypothetical protein